MKCVICKHGGVQPATVEAKITVGWDRVIVAVHAEACRECGEAYYPPEVLRQLQRSAPVLYSAPWHGSDSTRAERAGPCSRG